MVTRSTVRLDLPVRLERVITLTVVGYLSIDEDCRFRSDITVVRTDECAVVGDFVAAIRLVPKKTHCDKSCC